MCFDAKTSAITFSIAMVSSIYLYYRGTIKHDNIDKFFSIIVILIGLMQLLEYFIWKNQNCNYINHKLSLLILVILTLQPILGSAWYYHLFHKNTIFPYHVYLLYSIVFSIFGIYLIYWLNKTQLCSKPTKKSCRLHWASYKKLSDHKPYFIIWSILYSVPWFCWLFDFSTWGYKYFKKYPIRFLFLPISFLITVLYILNKNNSIDEFIKNPMMFTKYVDVWGSLWCFSAVFLGIVSILEI